MFVFGNSMCLYLKLDEFFKYWISYSRSFFILFFATFFHFFSVVTVYVCIVLCIFYWWIWSEIRVLFRYLFIFVLFKLINIEEEKEFWLEKCRQLNDENECIKLKIGHLEEQNIDLQKMCEVSMYVASFIFKIFNSYRYIC